MNLSATAVRKKVRWSTGAFFFISGIVITSWTSRIPDLQDKFQLTNAELGWVLLSTNTGLVCFLPFTSSVIARFSSWRVMTIGAIAYLLMLPLLASAGYVQLLVPLLFVFGAVRTFFSISANTNAVEVQPLFERPILAKFHGIWSLACLAGVGIGALMIAQSIAPPIHYIIISLLGLAAVYFFKRNKNAISRIQERRPLFVKPDRFLLLLGCIAFFSMSCESAMFDWSINYFQKVVKAKKEWVTIGYGCFITMFTIGRLVGDKWIARFGSYAMLFSSGLLMCIGFGISIFFAGIVGASVGFLLVGTGSSLVIPMVYGLAGKSTKMLPTYAIVSVTMLGYVGFLTCPLFIGLLAERWGMQAGFGLMAFYASGIALIILLIKKLKVVP